MTEQLIKTRLKKLREQLKSECRRHKKYVQSKRAEIAITAKLLNLSQFIDMGQELLGEKETVDAPSCNGHVNRVNQTTLFN